MVPQACATTTSPGISVSTVVIAAPIATVLVITIVFVLVISLSIPCHRMRRKRNNQFRANNRANDLNVTTNRDGVGISLQYNASYFQSDSIHQTQNTTVMAYQSNDSSTCTQSAPTAHTIIPSQSYVISSHENGHCSSSFEYNQLYWDPACKEEDLKHQLQMLRVEEICKDKIEYVRVVTVRPC